MNLKRLQLIFPVRDRYIAVKKCPNTLKASTIFMQSKIPNEEDKHIFKMWKMNCMPLLNLKEIGKLEQMA